jgi:2-dehydro-3-deoxyphosphogluconate aldolase/(4S)-4-hydroxy-2-oxoglutarate aldolase
MQMNPETAYSMIEKSGVMAGMRGAFVPDVALSVANVLMECDINIFELTMNSDQPLEAMQAIKREFGADACVGMGTVLDLDTAKRALDAGADFVVAPSFNRDVVLHVQASGVLAIPGVMTPTECVDAWALGAKLLKLFPAGSLGLDYFKALRGPLAHMKFLCNGGINDVTTRDFIKAGAVGCGAAAWLTGEGSMALETIRQRGQMLRAVVTEVRTGQVLHKV